MRSITLALLLTSIVNLQGQDLIDKNWTKFHIERLDGSRVISRTNIVESPLNYYFQENGKVSIATVLGQEEIDYALKDSMISIGSHQLYQIDTLSDTLLILIELPEHPVDDDKINSIFFSTEEHYANNVISKNLVRFLNDSTIISNRHLRPQYTGGSLELYLYNELITLNQKNSELKGSFIVTPTGQIIDLIVNNDEDINEKVKEKTLTLLLETSYRWRTTRTKTPYYYMVCFTVVFEDSFIGFSYFETSETPHFPYIDIEIQQRANDYFQKGNRFLSKDNYEKAIWNYSKCLEIDEIFLDAYYNRAYANKMLGNYNKSCIDWGILSELGQAEAMKIFNQFCNRKIE
jgi:tetratricopeptide (TPR) repeat protein